MNKKKKTRKKLILDFFLLSHHPFDQRSFGAFPSSPLLKRKLIQGTALKLASASFLADQQLLSPKRGNIRGWLTLHCLTDCSFKIPHHVCFLYLEDWSGMGYFDPGSNKDSVLNGPERKTRHV